MYKIAFFVPESHLEAVKEALFAAGAGTLGDYARCAWQIRGEGQFMPLAGADPFTGSPGVLERVPEFKVEMVCADDCIATAVAALRQAHPYETPAYEVWPLADF
ncbi:YqfO family protein [Aestuariirhabdus litorea]|uniref:NGG1p interacting factor NIF3 n=1 Tax=Aestuariirhabdus litorea TaxID=2528527 RepID=A0A3P3VR70_9GAMM|nr:YqfO family protein [Aestuariirhabdus litorea]RRJ85292.1 NGG1p interacting factor NIF3 [Aestuariirhabdus litorea]RWW98514.1 NGG1p interacting factor NIF3 [Endozoicomonadaceae bacterium GTF-13]